MHKYLILELQARLNKYVIERNYAFMFVNIEYILRNAYQHPDIDDARCYYWCVMSEAMLEFKGNIQQSITCIKKAVACSATYPDWRIIASKLILTSAESLSGNIAKLDADDMQQSPDEELDPAEVLSGALQVYFYAEKILINFDVVDAGSNQRRTSYEVIASYV